VITGIAAFLGLPALLWIISFFLDIQSHSLMGLALFHTIFNVLGVLIFSPFLGLLTRLLMRVYPDYKTIVTAYLDQTPPEVTDAATAALRKEIGHLLQECQLYNLRLLRIDEKLVFDADLPFEHSRRRSTRWTSYTKISSCSTLKSSPSTLEFNHTNSLSQKSRSWIA
jgi:phosphate:Na+ symporter